MSEENLYALEVRFVNGDTVTTSNIAEDNKIPLEELSGKQGLNMGEDKNGTSIWVNLNHVLTVKYRKQEGKVL